MMVLTFNQVVNLTHTTICTQPTSFLCLYPKLSRIQIQTLNANVRQENVFIFAAVKIIFESTEKWCCSAEQKLICLALEGNDKLFCYLIGGLVGTVTRNLY